LQRLPSFQYDLVGRSLDGITQAGRQSPRLSVNSRYDHFYRRTDENSAVTEIGHRLRFQPTLDWTRALGPANFKLTGGLEMAAYATDGRRLSTPFDRDQAEHDRWYNFLTGSAEAELSTTFSRVFEGGLGRAEATRHLLSPTLAFKYVGASEDQGRLPFWDSLDRRLPRRTIRYGLENILVAKTPSQAAPAKSPPATPVEGPIATPAYNYSQFLKIGLWSSYELADNSHLTSQPLYRYYNSDYYGQGAGPLEVSLEAFLTPNFSTRLVSSFNTRTGQAMSHDLSLYMADNRGDWLTLTYDYDAPEARYLPVDARGHQEIRADLGLVFNSEWSARLSSRFDLKDNRALESTAQFTYQAQCYGLSLVYNKTYSAESIGVVIDLLGLGSIDLRGSGF